MEQKRKMRVLHIFARMDRGGAETWIVNILRNIDRDAYQFDFLVQPGPVGAYDELIRRLGGRIIPGPSPRNPMHFALALHRLFNALWAL